MKAYYNEHDPKATAWLRELISAGHIAPGDVDERSITDVRADDLVGYSQCHFFAGIGGWSLALRLAGVPDNYPVWTGSCPCQPFSAAGKRRGASDDRHLWPDFMRLIRECAPAIIFGEQVEGAVRLGWLDGVFGDLEGEGYACGAHVLGAHSVGAPHIRQRLYWLAYAGRLPERRTAGPGEAESGRALGDAAGLRESRRLANSIGTGLEGFSGDGGDGNESGRIDPEQAGSVAASGCAGGLGNANSAGREALQSFTEPAGARSERALQSGPSGGLADAKHDGGRTDEQGREAKGRVTHGRPGADTWGNFDLLPCRDGKARRVEAGTFPLAHGVSGRVGLLRGYGNAIVPPLAAEFIEEALAAIREAR